MEQILTKYPFLGFLESRIGGRSENQDSYGYVETPDGLLVVVCDGMGGGPGGKTASSTVVEIIKQSIVESSHHQKNREEALKLAVERAHMALLNKMEIMPVLRGMGTTIAALYINNESAIVVHIGDSRIYKLRDGIKVFRTQDHSMVGEMVRNGTLTEEQARLSAQSNIITRAIGIDGKSQPDIEVIPFEKGDRFVLCSDGIWGAMPEAQLIKCFSERRSPANIVESMSNKVDEIGRDKGGHHDNLTLAMIETKIDSKLKETMNRKAKMIIGAIGFLLVVSIIFNMAQSCSKHRSLSQENKIEELEATIQKKDSEIQALKESSEKSKEKESLLTEEVERYKEQIKRYESNKDNVQPKEYSATHGQQKPQTETREEKGSSSSSKNPSVFDEKKRRIILTLEELSNLDVGNVTKGQKEITRRQKLINNILNEMKSQCPEKMQSIRKIQNAIDWIYIGGKIDENGKLTQSGQNKVKDIINQIKNIN